MSTSAAAPVGVLLLNLGTPDDPSPEAVGRYLTEFLLDKWVIDIPTVFRHFLVRALIVPKRKYASSEAYQKVWSKVDGSPLKAELLRATEGLRRELGSEFIVEPAMRYQNPSIEAALKKFQASGVKEVRVLPLYPQYAEATNRSSEEKIWEVLGRIGYAPKITLLKPYFEDPRFTNSFASAIRESLAHRKQGGKPFVLFSYHGLPERQIKKADPSKTHCLADKSCCDAISPKNEAFCYRAHCFATTRALVKTLGLKEAEYALSFQSRLGRTKWLDPDTVTVVSDLARRGVKDLLVVCPAFTADCLETLEEIGIRLREQFLSEGGEHFDFVRSLNARPEWVAALADFSKHGSYLPLPQ